MPAIPDARLRLAGLGGLFVVAVVVGLELARPLRSASVAIDSQVAVLQFERIVGGVRLEQFLPTTSKPLLTAIYGSLHALTGDWRPIAWAAILAFAVAVAGVGALAARVGGPLAGAFAGFAVLASPTLLFDAGFALATPWALLGWVAAGLALSADRPRYGLAGLALLLATLARLETLVVVALVVAVLAGAVLARRPAPRRAWLVPLVGVAAVPVMGVHDWLLAGDPWLWSEVAARYTAQTVLHVMSPAEVVGFLLARSADAGALTLLAIVGWIRLVAARRHAIALGLLGLGPGVAAFLVALALRGIFVSDRYAASIDIAVAVAAGIGFAGLAVDGIEWVTARSAALRSAGGRQSAAISGAVLAAIVLAWPRGPFDATLRAQVHESLLQGVDADRAVAILRPALAGAGPQPTPRIRAATPIRIRIAVDLRDRLTEVEPIEDVTVGATGDGLLPGQLLVHDRRAERNPDGRAGLEVDEPAVLGERTLEPLLADRRRGLWVVAVR